MKIVKITSVFPKQLEAIAAKTPRFDQLSLAEQTAVVRAEVLAATGAWGDVLPARGYEYHEIFENVVGGAPAVVESLKLLKPDILWFDSANAQLLRRIREEAPRPRLIVGWVGSAFPAETFWEHVDAMLTCAPESVGRLAGLGVRAAHMHHSFDARVLARLKPRPEVPLSFVGYIIRKAEFHTTREKILERVAAELPLEIYAPGADRGELGELLFFGGRTAFYHLTRALRFARVPEATLKRLPLVRKVVHMRSAPMLAVNPRLKKLLRPGVFGLEMLELLKASRVTLNIHAASSPTHASNMRLFESTGVGTCLLTDWRDNLPELFEPEREVVTYRSIDECVEKAKWLLEHPVERARIAEAGQKRTLRQHSLEARAEQLDRIFRGWLG